MKFCDNQDLLEQYALGLERNPEIRRKLFNHLRICPLCRHYVEERKQLEKLLASEPNQSERGFIHEVQQKILPPKASKIIQLNPGQSSESTDVLCRLAADSNQNTSYDVLAIYQNESEDVIIRLVADRKQNTYSLHLICKDKTHYEDTLLQFEGMDNHFIFDERNQISLSKDEAEALLTRKATIQSPISTFQLHPVSADAEKTLFDGVIVLDNENYEKIQIDISNQDGREIYKFQIINLKKSFENQKLRIVVFQEDKQPAFATMSQGVAKMDGIDIGKMLKIHIY
ncbi:hypothetical protein EH221_01355 [bacterium]|nr:MAG: hypothetical protein EH221_01355 [bacterium]